MTEPEWLTWTRELQAIAQTGLAFTDSPYDRERYEQLRAIASKMMAARSDGTAERIDTLFANERGYATPKVDVRGATFDDRGRILMVRERSDADRWTLPGGWADVNMTLGECVVKEVREETGYHVRVRKLAAVWDRTRQGHGSGVFSCVKVFFLCDLVGGTATPSLETTEVQWFAEPDIPADLSRGRTLPHQVRRMFEHARNERLGTDFE